MISLRIATLWLSSEFGSGAFPDPEYASTKAHVGSAAASIQGEFDGSFDVRNCDGPTVTSAPLSIPVTMARSHVGAGTTSESAWATISPAAISAALFLSCQ